jgi:hypothetical protein
MRSAPQKRYRYFLTTVELSDDDDPSDDLDYGFYRALKHFEPPCYTKEVPEPPPFRVDAYCSGGWQHLASFASETHAYEYGEAHARTGGARVWKGGECIAVSYGGRSWSAPRHTRNCDGKPCECGAVPPIGSMALGTGAA